MGFVQFLITKLVGYDILESESELKSSLANAKKELSSITKHRNALKAETEHKQGEITAAQKEVAKAKEELSALSNKYNQISETLHTKDGEIENLTSTVSSKEKEIERLASSVRLKDTEIEGLAEQVKEKDNDLEKISKTLSGKESEIVELNSKVDTLKAQARSKQGTIMNHVKKINTLTEEVVALKEENKKLQKDQQELVELRDGISILKNEKQTLEYQVDLINNQKQSLESANQKLNNEIASLEQELANAPSDKSDEIRELEERLQKSEESIQKKNREIEVLQIAKKEGETRFEEVCKELKSVRNDKDSLSEKVQNLEGQIANLKKDNAALEKRLSEVSSELASPDKLTDDIVKPVEPNEDTEHVVPEGDNLGTSPIETVPQGIATDGVEKNPQGNEDDKISEPTNVAKPSIRKTPKSKEEETIDLGSGSIVDLPPIINDSNRHVQRAIEYVFDDKGKKVLASEFFMKTAEEIALVSRKMSEAEISGDRYWTCGLCHHRVKIAHRTYKGKESLFFIHANKDHYCPWIKLSEGSQDDPSEEMLLASGETENEVTERDFKPKSRELKEKIYAALTSPTSEEMGITDVRLDEIIRSNVPYMRWRRPDISFNHKGRKVVIELQKKSHDIDTIVDRDVFFRLNDIQVLWVFGSDSDSSYDYMRRLNYKNTMFDNHRNVFVFDKEAQLTSEENGTLYLKCNWLNEDDAWYFRLENSGANGKMVNVEDLIYDDEFCKPYHYDANDEYFTKHPDAREAYLATKMTREELKKSIEEKWTRDSNYEAAQALMRQRESKATPYCVSGLWGFRFNTTVIIPPIFTVEPKDLYNGFYAVRQGDMSGIVNYYGEKVVDWDGCIICEEINYDALNERVLFSRDGLWGVADISGNELIPAAYQSIQIWSNMVYRVRKNNKWGLCDINNNILVECKFDKIDELSNSRAAAVKPHPTKGWLTVSGYIDGSGRELYTTKITQQDGLFVVQSFELWGIINEEGETIVPCHYEEILPWAKNLYRIRENGKWGIYDIADHTFLLETTFDSIGELNNGVAKTVFARVESAIDVFGKEVFQEVVQLQNGLKKTKVAGKWGIVNDKGEVVIEHRYNEIGSFRSRMIGIINNGEVIKLNHNYDYPILLTGKYIKSEGKNHYFDIGAAQCVMPDGLLKQANKALATILNPNKECESLAFGNIVRNKYLLRVVDAKGLNKKLSHGDLEGSFITGKLMTGTVIRFKSNKGIRRKMIVRFPDGKETTVPRRFFKPATRIDNIRAGQSISLKKTGYDKENDQTIWEIMRIE